MTVTKSRPQMFYKFNKKNEELFIKKQKDEKLSLFCNKLSIKSRRVRVVIVVEFKTPSINPNGH